MRHITSTDAIYHPEIPEDEWLELVKKFVLDVMDAADESRPTPYSCRIDGLLLPYGGIS